jgi:hypothetical protein
LDGSQQILELDRQKILQRLVKALLLRKRYSEAKKRLAGIVEGPERAAFEQAMRREISEQPIVAKAGETLQRARELPYTKPHMVNVAEFFVVGHDTPGSLYDPLLISGASESETLAFFFAGIGDARHAFQSIIAIHRLEEIKKLETKKMRFYFTLNDVKHEVLARDLIFFLLLERLCSELATGEIVKDHRMVQEPAKKTLLTLTYIYIAQIVPPEVHDDLKAVLTTAIGILLSRASLPAWIDISNEDAKAIIPILKNWQHEVTKAFPTAKFIQGARKAPPQENRHAFSKGHCWQKAEPMKEELRQFRDCALVLPSDHATHADLQAILQTPKSESRTSQLRHYLSKTWKENFTLIDMKWVRAGDASRPDHYFNVGHNPFELAEDLSSARIPTEPERPEQLYDYGAQFFLNVAMSLSAIRDRLKVEFMSGDVVRILEGIKCGAQLDRDVSYPVRYDRIHTSNIP